MEEEKIESSAERKVRIRKFLKLAGWVIAILIVGYHLYDFYRVRALTVQNSQQTKEIVDFINKAIQNAQK